MPSERQVMEARAAAVAATRGDSKLAKHECIPFAAVPHSTPLFLDFISQSSKVNLFYPQKPIVEDVATFARGLAYPPERRAAVAGILERQNHVFGSSRSAMESI